MEEEMVKDLQKLIRKIRFDANVERNIGSGVKADIMEDIAASFEKIMLQYTAPAPLVPGYPRGFGWRSSAYTIFPLSHKA